MEKNMSTVKTKKITKENKQNIQHHQQYRLLVQLLFLFTTLWIGVEFIIFVDQLESGAASVISRPPGVEAFLPISALISLKYWLLTGIFNSIHPSGLVLLLIIMATAVFLKKGFCGWVCPIGLLSDWLAKLNQWIFPKSFKMPKFLDYPLRSLKYLLLLFFLYAIVIQMDVTQLKLFIYSPYNRIADIKMYYFFKYISAFSLKVILILVLLSVVFPYFWCRYLCPYGALLGFTSIISPFKIRRNAETCIDCEKCTKVCPARLPVHRKKQIQSDECNACMNCVAACPVKDTLYMATPSNKYKLSIKHYAIIIILLFVIGTTTARIFGVWQNSITTDEYRYHLEHLHDQGYDHGRGSVPQYDHDKWVPKESNPR
ncbi:MAG: 4Fe-4S binding protein [Calditrichia bacterium]